MSRCGAAGTAGMTLMRIGKLAECILVEFCRSFARVIGGFLVVGLYQDYC
jgi:hypothetical protein